MGMRAGEVTPLLGPDGTLPDRNTHKRPSVTYQDTLAASSVRQQTELTRFKQH